MKTAATQKIPSQVKAYEVGQRVVLNNGTRGVIKEFYLSSEHGAQRDMCFYLFENAMNGTQFTVGHIEIARASTQTPTAALSQPTPCQQQQCNAGAAARKDPADMSAVELQALYYKTRDERDALRTVLELATATVELHTANGAQSQPVWPRDAAGNVDYEATAAVCRAALFTGPQAGAQEYKLCDLRGEQVLGNGKVAYRVNNLIQHEQAHAGLYGALEAILHDEVVFHAAVNDHHPIGMFSKAELKAAICRVYEIAQPAHAKVQA